MADMADIYGRHRKVSVWPALIGLITAGPAGADGSVQEGREAHTKVTGEAPQSERDVVPARGGLQQRRALPYGQWHALIDCYGQHRRPVARSN